MSKKNELRKNAIDILKSITDKPSRDIAICSELMQNSHYAQADTVLLYSPLKNEPNISALAADAKAKGKRIAYPRCESGGVMRYYVAECSDVLVKSKYGVLEPPDGCEALTGFDNAICLVPGLGFTEDGYRLGRGGGYYDRFLANCDIYTVGVGYKESLLRYLPTEPTDIPLKEIILK